MKNHFETLTTYSYTYRTYQLFIRYYGQSFDIAFRIWHYEQHLPEIMRITQTFHITKEISTADIAILRNFEQIEIFKLDSVKES